MTSDDGLLDVADKAITISIDSSTTFTVRTDSNGIARLSGNNAIEKGKTYSISGGTRENYITPPSQTYKARLNERQVTIVYRKTLTGSTTITINVGCSDGSSAMNGKTVYMISNNSTTYDFQVINNGTVTFTNVPLWQSYTISFEGGVVGYKTPGQQNIVTSDSSITLNAIYELFTQASGIYLRRSDGLEVLCSELIESSGSTWTIKEEYQKEGETWVAFHITFQKLFESGNDYYIRPLDLTSKRTIVSKQWSTNQVTYPSVEMKDTFNNLTRLDGKKETYLMFKDARSLEIQSPAANYAKTQTLVLGDKTLYGFIGTAPQMNYIYDNTNGNRSIITNTLYALGYTTSTTGTPTFDSTSTWSSSQGNYNGSWKWISTGWNYGGFRTDNNLVLPLFLVD